MLERTRDRLETWFGDPFVLYLKSLGYNSIRLPKENIEPLEVLQRSGGDLHRFDKLDRVMMSDGTERLPDISRDNAAADINSAY
jgi:hypothetical protein